MNVVEITTLDRDSAQIRKLAKDLGYSAEEAERLRENKFNLFKNDDVYIQYLKDKEEHINLQYVIPLDVFGTYSEWMSQSVDVRLSRLWNIGFDIEVFEPTIDVGCTTLDERRYCGYLLIGQERTDKEWVKMIINNKHVASWEAQLKHANDWSLRLELAKLSRGT